MESIELRHAFAHSRATGVAIALMPSAPTVQTQDEGFPLRTIVFANGIGERLALGRRALEISAHHFELSAIDAPIGDRPEVRGARDSARQVLGNSTRLIDLAERPQNM